MLLRRSPCCHISFFLFVVAGNSDSDNSEGDESDLSDEDDGDDDGGDGNDGDDKEQQHKAGNGVDPNEGTAFFIMLYITCGVRNASE